MTSPLLTKMGLGKVDIGIFILLMLIMLIAAIVLLIIFIIKNNKLQRRYEKFMQGDKAISLEEQIWNISENVAQLNDEMTLNTDDINLLFKRLEMVFQKMGLIKYDAYKEMGGKLSYALTLLDEKNNGFLINSVHSSTGCYSYTKRIKAGKCELELSPEEQSSLDKAMGKAK